MNEETKRFFFDQDDDGHEYMIPVEWREEWNTLVEEGEGWAKPEWAKFENCRCESISSITFENPKEDGR